MLLVLVFTGFGVGDTWVVEPQSGAAFALALASGGGAVCCAAIACRGGG